MDFARSYAVHAVITDRVALAIHKNITSYSLRDKNFEKFVVVGRIAPVAEKGLYRLSFIMWAQAQRRTLQLAIRPDAGTAIMEKSIPSDSILRRYEVVFELDKTIASAALEFGLGSSGAGTVFLDNVKLIAPEPVFSSPTVAHGEFAGIPAPDAGAAGGMHKPAFVFDTRGRCVMTDRSVWVVLVRDIDKRPALVVWPRH
jgi:hypothetical protein